MKNNLKDLCSVLVNSCDRYRTTWSPFFTLYAKYFHESPFSLYLNTEKEIFPSESVTTLNCDCECWSDRLKSCLDRINTKYVILLLDDFFFQKKVNFDFILKSLETMEKDDTINCIYFKKISTKYLGEYNNELYVMDNSRKYILNFQAALWKRDQLVKLIPSKSDAWKIEDLQLTEEKGKFLCLKTGSFTKLKNDVFNYLWSIKSGYGICKSKWLWNNEKFFEKEGIVVNFYELGKMEKKEYHRLFIKSLFRKKKGKIKNE